MSGFLSQSGGALGSKIVWYITLALSLLLSGCGYRLAVHESLKGRSVAVPVFANKTLRPNLESCLTAKVVDRFAGSGGATVVKSDQAELALTGTILAYNESASGFTADDKVAMYQLSMTVEAALRQVSNGAVIWKGTLRAVQDYPTSSDLALKINAQEAALRELCRKLAESIERESGNRF